MLTTDQVLGKGRYRIISNFKQDGTGSLYEAYDTVNKSTVVLRETIGSSGGVMTPAQLDEINNIFEGEAKTLTEVDHESLLHVQDYFSEIDRHYLVMESVDGCDLTKFLDPTENAPALGDVMKWADQILAALEHLHTLPTPIVHRDIRPANIRLTSAFKVKLLTAGVSSHEVIMASAANPADSSVLNYRPLEQLWGGLDPASQKVITNSYDDRARRILQQPLDARSDIYAVGATLYHVITRTLPKDALERSIELLDGNSDPLPSPSEIDPSISEELSEVLMKSMELRREHRYDSAGIMRQVLNSSWQRIQVKRSSEPQPRPTPEPVSVAEPTQTVVDLERLKKQEIAPPAKSAQVDNFTAQEEIRAEERRREIEADREKLRLEAERIKLAEMEAISSPVRSEDLLLEVEPVKTADDDFEWSVDISEQPSRTTSETKALHDSEGLDFNLPVGSSSNLKFIVAGAGTLVVVVAIVGWLFMGGSSTPVSSQKAAAPVVQQPAQTEQIPTSAFAESNSNTASTEQAPQLNETVTAEGKQETKPAAKEKKPATAPAKKKVTVDDLINDN
jgi:serine/threonine protein kinase